MTSRRRPALTAILIGALTALAPYVRGRTNAFVPKSLEISNYSGDWHRAATAFDAYIRSHYGQENVTFFLPAGEFATRGAAATWAAVAAQSGEPAPLNTPEDPTLQPVAADISDYPSARYERGFEMLNGWRFQGAGQENTTVKLVYCPYWTRQPDAAATRYGLNTVFRSRQGPAPDKTEVVSVSELTIDCNYPWFQSQYGSDNFKLAAVELMSRNTRVERVKVINAASWRRDGKRSDFPHCPGGVPNRDEMFIIYASNKYAYPTFVAEKGFKSLSPPFSGQAIVESCVVDQYRGGYVTAINFGGNTHGKCINNKVFFDDFLFDDLDALESIARPDCGESTVNTEQHYGLGMAGSVHNLEFSSNYVKNATRAFNVDTGERNFSAGKTVGVSKNVEISNNEFIDCYRGVHITNAQDLVITNNYMTVRVRDPRNRDKHGGGVFIYNPHPCPTNPRAQTRDILVTRNTIEPTDLTTTNRRLSGILFGHPTQGTSGVPFEGKGPAIAAEARGNHIHSKLMINRFTPSETTDFPGNENTVSDRLYSTSASTGTPTRNRLSYPPVSGKIRNPSFYITRVRVTDAETGADVINNATSGRKGFTQFSEDSWRLARSTPSHQSRYHINIQVRPKNNPSVVQIWIDYNRDGDFEDENERVASQSAQNGSTSVSVVVPQRSMPPNHPLASQCAEFGETIMRVRVHPSEVEADEDTALGETEDYMVYLQPR